jgi:hypothetical protein
MYIPSVMRFWCFAHSTIVFALSISSWSSAFICSNSGRDVHASLPRREPKLASMRDRLSPSRAALLYMAFRGFLSSWHVMSMNCSWSSRFRSASWACARSASTESRCSRRMADTSDQTPTQLRTSPDASDENSGWRS